MIRELEFKILCERHSDEIYRYARGLLGQPAEAEDATQEVLLRLWRHLPRVNPFNLRAWLLQTTRWYCLDQIRRRRCRWKRDWPRVNNWGLPFWVGGGMVAA